MQEKLLKVTTLLRKVEVIKACNFQSAEAKSSEAEITHNLQLNKDPCHFHSFYWKI